MSSTVQNNAALHPTVLECLQKYGIEFRVLECDPQLADTAAFCSHYGFDPEQAANAIVVAGKSDPVKYACCMVLATTKLDVNKKVRHLLEVSRASFATAEQTLELTGMQIGGVTPFGLQSIPLLIDAAVMQHPEVIAGGGNRSSKVLLNPEEFKKLPNVRIIEAMAIRKE